MQFKNTVACRLVVKLKRIGVSATLAKIGFSQEKPQLSRGGSFRLRAESENSPKITISSWISFDGCADKSDQVNESVC